jgi:hypothetical protein
VRVCGRYPFGASRRGRGKAGMRSCPKGCAALVTRSNRAFEKGEGSFILPMLPAAADVAQGRRAAIAWKQGQ